MVNLLQLNKIKTDEEMINISNTFLTGEEDYLIINEDCDAYCGDKLLFKFRKNVLTQSESFYKNVINFAKSSYSTNRGSASGSLKKNVSDNPKVYSNVIGFVDGFSPRQKQLIRQKNLSFDHDIRHCRFNVDYPMKYNNLLPYIQEIDKHYSNLLPDYYSKQISKKTLFKIEDTAFTTITTNVNYQTSIHKDKGDDPEGFGNLSVIENGEYTGGEICFPQYGVGINLRTNDILYMDTHEYHGNFPIYKIAPKAIRLSVVCYLKQKVYEKTKEVNETDMNLHINKIKTIRKVTVSPTVAKQPSNA